MQVSQLGWESFIDNFPDPIARYNQEYKHLFIKKAIEQEIGLPASEVIGKSNRDLQIPHDEVLLAELERKIKNVFDKGQPAANYTQHEFPHGTRYYYMKLIPDFPNPNAPQGTVRSVWAITRDITHLKQTEVNLKTAEVNLLKQNAELNQLNRDLDTFFHTVSHDMGNPLINMKGLVGLLKEAEPAELPLIISMLEKTTQHFEDILTGLTEILRLQNKEASAEPIDLGEILQVIQSELHLVIRQTQTTIHADFSSCPSVRYARPYLESLFRNLISNAIKYRSPGRSPYIQITANQAAGQVILTFQDNGQGMDLARNGEKIFRPFYQIDGRQEGKGMGLNIVKNIVERNGGRIEVQSQVGMGTTFICYLN